MQDRLGREDVLGPKVERGFRLNGWTTLSRALRTGLSG